METNWSEAVAILFVLAMGAGYLWVLITYQTDSRPARLAQMMDRLGFDTTDFNQWRVELYLPTAARTCRECGSKAECDAWLAKHRKAAAAPAFCANADVPRLAAALQWVRAD